jgi:ethanolamine utilization protein EutA
VARHHHHHHHHHGGFIGDHHGEGEVYEIIPDPREDARWNPDDIELTTVGIDIGSATSHLILSKLHLRRLGRRLTSRFVVVSREVLYRSPILLTPYTSDYRIDADKLEAFFQAAFQESGLSPDAIDTGAVILTGEAVKRTNARSIADLFAGEAGKFVCATAGHNLEAVMAAHGSGAVGFSRDEEQTVLNVDIGGGTAKLALVANGVLQETSTLNVGGRLVAFDETGHISRIEPAARAVADSLGIDLQLGADLPAEDRKRLVDAFVDELFTAIGREPLSALGQELTLTPPLRSTAAIDAITFSGGVAEHLADASLHSFGDLGRDLADAILARIATGNLPAPAEAATNGIRATVLGASQFTVQVSGDTISVSRPDLLPLRNLRVVSVPLSQNGEVTAEEFSAAIREGFRRSDLNEGEQAVALATNWNGTPHYGALRSLAEGFKQGLPNSVAAGLPLVLVFASDVGKLVGDILRLEMDVANDVVSIDGIELQEFDYIDVGSIIEPAYVVPTVVKSLVFPDGLVDSRAELVG